MSKKIIYITSQSPFGNGEIWALREMISHVESEIDLIIVPRTGYGKIFHKTAYKLLKRTIGTPFINIQIIFALLKKITIELIDFIGIIKWIINHSNSFLDLAKGLIVLPKSLFISNRLKGKDIDHIHAFSTTSVAVVAYIIAHELKIPWSITFHASWHLNSKHLKSTKLQLKSVSFVRTISNEVRLSLIKFVGQSYEHKIKTIHIGVKCEKINQGDSELKNTINIVSVGGLLPHKGVDISIVAAKKLIDVGVKNFKWNFYGQGILLEELSEQVKEFGLTENIIFAGNIDNSSLMDLYKSRKIDLYVQNSINRFNIHEGIPVSIMEAMSHSIPVIATDCGGINELVNLESGILIKMGDPDETFNAIYSLIKNPEKLTTIGKKGRNKIMEDFDTHKISTQLSREFFK
jgi:glycosyltransferase involved in cell wall biosynthesis